MRKLFLATDAIVAVPSRRAWDGDAAPQAPRLALGAGLVIMMLLSLALWAAIWGAIALCGGFFR